METLNSYLESIYNSEQEKVAAVSLEDQLMGLSTDELLKIATGKKTAGVMSLERRESLPAKSFAVPKKKAERAGTEVKGEAKGAYPIPDRKHARNALARVAQHGTPAEKEMVERKVHEKFPDIGKEASAKIAWADNWGRSLARMESETMKLASLRTKIANIGCHKTADFEKADEFTTPEAQEKAKVVRQALKATKGAPEHIRRAAVKVTAEKMKQAAVKIALTPGALTGYFAQGDPESTPRSGFWRGLGGGMIGGTVGHLGGGLLGGALGGPTGALVGQAVGGLAGDIGGGYLGGRTARATPEEMEAYLAKKRALAETAAAKAAR